jgi:hypothetical protein
MKITLLFLPLLFICAIQTGPSWAQQQGEVFNGTVEAMNAGQGTLTVKNELGRQVVLELTNPDLLRGVSQGDQVSIELERPGVAKKVTRLSVPDLKAPVQTEK